MVHVDYFLHYVCWLRVKSATRWRQDSGAGQNLRATSPQLKHQSILLCNLHSDRPAYFIRIHLSSFKVSTTGVVECRNRQEVGLILNEHGVRLRREGLTIVYRLPGSLFDFACLEVFLFHTIFRSNGDQTSSRSCR